MTSVTKRRLQKGFYKRLIVWQGLVDVDNVRHAVAKLKDTKKCG